MPHAACHAPRACNHPVPLILPSAGADALPVDVFSAGLTLYAIWDACREETSKDTATVGAVDEKAKSEEAFERIAAVKQAGELPAAWCQRAPPQLAALVARMVQRDAASRPTARDCMRMLLDAEEQPPSSSGAALASPAAPGPAAGTHARAPPKGAATARLSAPGQGGGRNGGGDAPRGLVHRMHQLDRVAKMQQALEKDMMEALSSCVMEDPPDPLIFVIEWLVQAHRQGQSLEPRDTSPSSVLESALGGSR